MKGIVFEIKPLFYSYKTPIAYQIKSSNVLLSPSSLLGAVYKNFIKLLNLDYSNDTLKKFLNNTKYTGLTLISRDNTNLVSMVRFAVLLKHHRIERDEKSKKKSEEGLGGKTWRTDAMAKEYVFTNGRIVGAFVVNDIDVFVEAIESIEYLGNSESLVSVQILEADLPIQVFKIGNSIANRTRDNVMLQMVSKSVDLLPSRGIIEQCGVLPEKPWGHRTGKDTCYVWNPLEPIERNRYRSLSYKDIIDVNHNREFMSIYSSKLGLDLVFSIDGFDCLYPSGRR